MRSWFNNVNLLGHVEKRSESASLRLRQLTDSSPRTQTGNRHVMTHCTRNERRQISGRAFGSLILFSSLEHSLFRYFLLFLFRGSSFWILLFLQLYYSFPRKLALREKMLSIQGYEALQQT